MEDEVDPPKLDAAMLLGSIARTNTALYRQLWEAGFGAADLHHIRGCHDLAQRLFATRYRASGVPFVTHLIGTASILASVGEGPPVIAAGLLHAAQQQGDFGLVRKSRRERDLRNRLGDDATNLVTAYAALPWGAAGVEQIVSRLDRASGLERKVLLIRIANEIEDHVELALAFSGPARREHAAALRSGCLAIARALDRPPLADALELVYGETDAATWVRGFEGTAPSGSYVVLPSAAALVRRLLRWRRC